MTGLETVKVLKINTETPLKLIDSYHKKVPHIIKYMGSKKNILPFVIDAIDDVYKGGKLYDLFGGTNVLSGALGHLIPIHANDIQEYSAIMARTYLSDFNWNKYPKNILSDIIDNASAYVSSIKRMFPELSFSYSENIGMEEFVALENAQKKLIEADLSSVSHHLFIKYYSGTYWSFEQCLWIDAIRKVADDYKNDPLYFVVISSLMFAMSYNSQSTGHYAQYRDAKKLSSKNDILIYRQKEILPYFSNKFIEFKNCLGENKLKHTVSSLDYKDCLELVKPGELIYSDPPYGFVHYSRFYHALETLVKYDYPEVDFKGRYRTDRHQSPFCKRATVKNAFGDMFLKIREKNANLILSYSNTGMISLEGITTLAELVLGNEYTISVRESNHTHSTMGRSDDKNRNVKEYLIIAHKQ